MAILLIAIAHILPLLLCRLVTESRPAMIYTAFAAIATGAAFGNPAYTAIDTAAVLLGLYFLWPLQPGVASRQKSTARAPVKKSVAAPKISQSISAELLSPAQWVDLSPKARKKPWGRYVGGAVLIFVVWLIFSHS